MKAIVIVCEDVQAEEISRLLASTLSLNGYRHDGPAVIEWPVDPPRRLHLIVDDIVPGSNADLFNRADPGCELCEGRGRYRDGQGCDTQCPCTFVGAST